MDRGIFNVDIAQTNVKVIFLHGNFRDESVNYVFERIWEEDYLNASFCSGEVEVA